MTDFCISHNHICVIQVWICKKGIKIQAIPSYRNESQTWWLWQQSKVCIMRNRFHMKFFLIIKFLCFHQQITMTRLSLIDRSINLLTHYHFDFDFDFPTNNGTKFNFRKTKWIKKITIIRQQRLHHHFSGKSRILLDWIDNLVPS